MSRSITTVAVLFIAGGVFIPACNRPAASPPQPVNPASVAASPPLIDPRVEAALAAAEAARAKAASELDAARSARRAAEETLAAARLVAEQARSGNIQALYPHLRPMPAIAADYSHTLPVPSELAAWASDIRLLDDLSAVQVTWELSSSGTAEGLFAIRLRLFDETGAFLESVRVPKPKLRPGDRLVDRIEIDAGSKARWHGPTRWYSLEAK
jgi:hypothetical protein